MKGARRFRGRRRRILRIRAGVSRRRNSRSQDVEQRNVAEDFYLAIHGSLADEWMSRHDVAR